MPEISWSRPRSHPIATSAQGFIAPAGKKLLLGQQEKAGHRRYLAVVVVRFP